MSRARPAGPGSPARRRPELLLATGNAHKLREYRALLRGLGLRLRTPADLGLALDVPEDAPTYAGNAVAKALAYARASGRLALADDSGLEVAALGGAPGVRSARYAGPAAGDRERVARLLERLGDRLPAERGARFVCAIALATPAGEVEVVEGECRGVIAAGPRGAHGFGYDPVFYLPELGRTLAELTPAAKNRLSHRGQAAARARLVLARWLGRPAAGSGGLPLG